MSRRMVNIDELRIAKSDLSGTTYIGEFKSFGEHYEWKWKQPINIAIGTSEIDDFMLSPPSCKCAVLHAGA